MVDVLKVALGYQQHGFAVYPLASGTRTPLNGSHGYKDATKDPEQAKNGGVNILITILA